MRCLDYSIPHELHEHVDFVGGTLRFNEPGFTFPSSRRLSDSDSDGDGDDDGDGDGDGDSSDDDDKQDPNKQFKSDGTGLCKGKTTIVYTLFTYFSDHYHIIATQLAIKVCLRLLPGHSTHQQTTR